MIYLLSSVKQYFRYYIDVPLLVRKLCQKHKVFVEYAKHIGCLRSFCRVYLYRFIYKNQYLKNVLDDFLFDYVREKCSDLLLVDTESICKDRRKESKTIWVFWWQGIDNAPITVKECIHSISSNLDVGENLVLIDKNNIDSYIELPANILDKLNSGEIMHAHFSDILRFGLLHIYGGIWLDSCVYITQPVSGFFEYPIASIKSRYTNHYRSHGRWHGCLFSGSQSNSFFNAIFSCLVRIHSDCGKGVDYLIMDFVIDAILAKNLPLNGYFIKFPYYSYDMHQMQKEIVTYSPIKNCVQVNHLNKLSWKLDAYNMQYFKRIG